MNKKYLGLLILFFIAFGCSEEDTINDSKNEIEYPQESGEKPNLIREPYLQMIRPTTATITWKTDSLAVNCQVVLENVSSGEKILKSGSLIEHENKVFNEVNFTNLNPDNKYNYSIYSNGHLLANGQDYFLKTAPENKALAFSFYALGDIGAKEFESFAQEPANRISELQTKPDFGLGLGDIVYPKGESSNYDNHLFKPFQKVFKNIPFYPVPGNHDWQTDPEKNFEVEWNLPNNEHYYSFNYSNTLFIGLDSSNGGFYEYEQQVTWLKNTLKENEGEFDWIVVYLHHGGRSCTYKRDYEHVINLYDIFANNKVDLVLNGHAHTYERLKPYDENGNIDPSTTSHNSYSQLDNQFISITIGAGGKIKNGWAPDVNNPDNCTDGSIVAYTEHVPSFGLFSIEERKLTFKAINSYTGETFDEFSITK